MDAFLKAQVISCFKTGCKNFGTSPWQQKEQVQSPWHCKEFGNSLYCGQKGDVARFNKLSTPTIEQHSEFDLIDDVAWQVKLSCIWTRNFWFGILFFRRQRSPVCLCYEKGLFSTSKIILLQIWDPVNSMNICDEFYIQWWQIWVSKIGEQLHYQSDFFSLDHQGLAPAFHCWIES